MSTRTYTVDDKVVVFNVDAFKQVFDSYRRSKKITSRKLEEQISEQLQVAVDTVHGWHYGKNSPGGIEYIEELARVMGMKDFTLLLTEYNGGHNMNRLTERQIAAAKRIYDICIWFLEEFSKTDGFNDYWLDFSHKGSNDPESDIYEYIDVLLEKVFLVLNQEYFDLHNLEIYEELCEYVNEDLYDIFNGKVSYAYRFEAPVDGNPSTSEDYNKATIRLNNIIKKYLD